MGTDQPIQGESFRVATQPELGAGVEATVQSGFEDFGTVKLAMTDVGNTGLHSMQLVADGNPSELPGSPGQHKQPGASPEKAPGLSETPPSETPPSEKPPAPPEQPPATKPPSLLEQLEKWEPPPGFPYGPGCPLPEPPCC